MRRSTTRGPARGPVRRTVVAQPDLMRKPSAATLIRPRLSIEHDHLARQQELGSPILAPRADPGQRPGTEQDSVAAEACSFLHEALAGVVLGAEGGVRAHGYECDDGVGLLRLLRDQPHGVRVRLGAKRLVETKYVRPSATDGAENESEWNNARHKHGSLLAGSTDQYAVLRLLVQLASRHLRGSLSPTRETRGEDPSYPESRPLAGRRVRPAGAARARAPVRHRHAAARAVRRVRRCGEPRGRVQGPRAVLLLGDRGRPPGAADGVSRRLEARIGRLCAR